MLFVRLSKVAPSPLKSGSNPVLLLIGYPELPGRNLRYRRILLPLFVSWKTVERARGVYRRAHSKEIHLYLRLFGPQKQRVL